MQQPGRNESRRMIVVAQSNCSRIEVKITTLPFKQSCTTCSPRQPGSRPSASSAYLGIFALPTVNTNYVIETYMYKNWELKLPVWRQNPFSFCALCRDLRFQELWPLPSNPPGATPPLHPSEDLHFPHSLTFPSDLSRRRMLRFVLYKFGTPGLK